MAEPATVTKPTIAQQVSTALDDLLTALEDALRPNPPPQALRDARDTLTRYQFDRRRLVDDVASLETVTEAEAGLGLDSPDDLADELDTAISNLEDAVFDLQSVANSLREKPHA